MEIKRKFFIGDDWLYYKIYSGPQKAEEILTTQIYEIVNKLYDHKKIAKFFFLRYYDDSYHIRLRFLVTDNKYIYDIIKIINDCFKDQIENRIISKIAVDTYNREIERYGKHTIEDIESLFSFHSSDCLTILKELATDDTLRWLYCIKYFDILLNQFGLSTKGKFEFCERCYKNSIADTASNKPVIVALDKKYRENSKEIDKYIASADVESVCFNDSKRADIFEQTIQQILFSVNKFQEVTLFELLNSVTHMNFNRFFRTKQPKNELVIYYLMAKHYKSQEARQKYTKV